MKIEKTADAKYFMELNGVVKQSIVNSIVCTMDDLGVEEIDTRTGFTMEEYQTLLQKIGRDPGEVTLSKDELIMIHQVLNEVSNGISVPDFNRQIGVPVSETRAWMAYLDSFIDE